MFETIIEEIERERLQIYKAQNEIEEIKEKIKSTILNINNLNRDYILINKKTRKDNVRGLFIVGTLFAMIVYLMTLNIGEPITLFLLLPASIFGFLTGKAITDIYKTYFLGEEELKTFLLKELESSIEFYNEYIENCLASIRESKQKIKGIKDEVRNA